MIYTFDSLGYARRLREHGVAQDHAEAHAEAARDFIMAELATKTDLLAVRTDLQAVKQELQSEFRSSIAELRSSVAELRSEVHSSIAELRGELHSSVAELRSSIVELRSNMNTQGLRLAVGLGALMVVALGALATIMKLVH
jgi:hypothetical protein